MALPADGHTAEVGIVGNEGLVGLPLVLGARCDIVESMVQRAGTMLRMSAAAFGRAKDIVPGLEKLLLRHGPAFHKQVTQTAAYNGRHTVEQWLARWLLIAHDRTEMTSSRPPMSSWR